MPKFIVVYVEGNATQNRESTSFISLPGRHRREIETANRSTAYIEAYQYFKEQGIDVCVAVHDGNNGHPLGFSDEELKIVHDANIPLNTSLITGVQIEEIFPQG